MMQWTSVVSPEYPVRKTGRLVLRGDAGPSRGAVGVIPWSHAAVALSRPGLPVARRPEAAGRPAVGAHGRPGGGEPAVSLPRLGGHPRKVGSTSTGKGRWGRGSGGGRFT